MRSTNRWLNRAYALVCIVLAACHLGDDTPTDPGGQTCAGAITAQIDGVPWSGSRANLVTYDGASLVVAGEDATGRAIGLLVPSVTRNGGTFTIDSSGTAAIAAYSEGPTKRWQAGTIGGTSGSIIVTTALQGRAAGTFSFEALASPFVTGNQATGTVHAVSGAFDLTC